MTTVIGEVDRTGAVAAIRGGLVVSCQAPPHTPMAASHVIAAVAAAVERGGASGLRIASPEHVAAVRVRTALPIVGLTKRYGDASPRPFITPDFDDCARLVEAGADILAVEAVTDSRRPGEIAELFARVSDELGAPIMADVSTLAEGVHAWDAGAALVATTLSGHTSSTAGRPQPDLDLVGALAASGVRAVLEGGVTDPSEVTAALAAGAWAVVVGPGLSDTQAQAAPIAGRLR